MRPAYLNLDPRGARRGGQQATRFRTSKNEESRVLSLKDSTERLHRAFLRASRLFKASPSD